LQRAKHFKGGITTELKEVSELLSELLEQNGITTYQMSKETGIPHTSIYSWVMGTRIPKTEIRKKLAEYFGKPKDYFM
jgi:transcriptional regulator with XRE-family HTH domain